MNQKVEKPGSSNSATPLVRLPSLAQNLLNSTNLPRSQSVNPSRLSFPEAICLIMNLLDAVKFVEPNACGSVWHNRFPGLLMTLLKKLSYDSILVEHYSGKKKRPTVKNVVVSEKRTKKVKGFCHLCGKTIILYYAELILPLTKSIF